MFRAVLLEKKKNGEEDGQNFLSASQKQIRGYVIKNLIETKNT